jgi:hypothetical protein
MLLLRSLQTAVAGADCLRAPYRRPHNKTGPEALPRAAAPLNDEVSQN